MDQRPVLLLDCNFSEASGQTFVAAVKRLAPEGMSFATVRVPDEREWSWVQQARDGGWAAMVVSGSAANPMDDLPWIPPLLNAVRELSEAGLPTLGICFGHQLIAHAWGGTVGTNVLGFKIRGVREVVVHDRPAARPTIATEADGSTLEVFSSHQDQVTEAPPGWHVVAHSEQCPIQAMRAPHRPILTVQWHPEGDEQFVRINPHPDWASLPDKPLTSLSGTRILTRFLEWVRER